MNSFQKVHIEAHFLKLMKFPEIILHTKLCCATCSKEIRNKWNIYKWNDTITDELTSSYGIAVADRAFRETPKSNLVDKKSPAAATVEPTAMRLLMFLFGNCANSTFWLALVA